MFKNLKLKREKMKKGYNWLDLCDIQYWFQTTFVDMINDFEKRKIGSPELLFEEIDNIDYDWIIINYSDVIEEMKKDKWFKDLTFEQIQKDYSLDDHYIKWKLILKRISYCFKQSNEDFCLEKNEFEEDYFNEKFGKINKVSDMFVPIEESNGKLYKIKENEVDKELEESYYNRENEIITYREKMKDEAFDLLKKYFFNLWD